MTFVILCLGVSISGLVVSSLAARSRLNIIEAILRDLNDRVSKLENAK